jgi:hypothetical protein
MKRDISCDLLLGSSEAEILLNNNGITRAGSVRERRHFVACMQILTGKRNSLNCTKEKYEQIKFIVNNCSNYGYCKENFGIETLKKAGKKLYEIEEEEDFKWVKTKVIKPITTLVKKEVSRKLVVPPRINTVELNKSISNKAKLDNTVMVKNCFEMLLEDKLSALREGRMNDYQEETFLYYDKRRIEEKIDHGKYMIERINNISVDPKDYIIPGKVEVKYTNQIVKTMGPVEESKKVIFNNVTYREDFRRFASVWRTVDDGVLFSRAKEIARKIMTTDMMPAARIRYCDLNYRSSDMNYKKARVRGSRKSSRISGKESKELNRTRNNIRYTELNESINRQIEDLEENIDEYAEKVLRDLKGAARIITSRAKNYKKKGRPGKGLTSFCGMKPEIMSKSEINFFVAVVKSIVTCLPVSVFQKNNYQRFSYYKKFKGRRGREDY